jgi:hypothetical protein
MIIRKANENDLDMLRSLYCELDEDAEFIRTQEFPQNEDGIRFYDRSGFKKMVKTIEYQL